MKKILFLISAIKRDGPNRVLESMIYGIDKTKYKIFVLSFLNNNDQSSLEKIEKMGATIIKLDLNNKLEIIIKGRKKLNKIINNIKPDIVHSHGVLPDIINAKSESEKKITTLHNNMFEDYIYSFGKLKGRLIILWHLFQLKKFDKCVCCSKSIYDVMKKKISNCDYIQNSIYRNNDIEEYGKIRERIREEYKILKDDIVYIYVGVLSNIKNVIGLVNSFNKTLKKNQYLLIIGDGPLRNELDGLIKNNNIILCGFKKNAYDYLCASDIYCSFSKSEGFSISVLEALETSNLLLLSDIPSHKEIFDIDEKIYIGENFNKNNFNEKKEIIECNFNKKNTSKEILKLYLNCKNMMESYSKIYKEV